MAFGASNFSEPIGAAYQRSSVRGADRGRSSLVAGETLRQQQEQLDLQTQIARAQQKKQNRLFEMLLGPEGGGQGTPAGGLIGDVFGNLVGGGGAGQPGSPDQGIGQPFFPDSSGPPMSGSPGSPGGFESAMPPLQQHGAVGAGVPAGAGAYGAGQRAALAEDFSNAQRNALGSLEMRGLGGSSLVGPAMASVARQKQLAGGELEDRLFREQLQFRAAERAPLFGLLGQLLGGLGV